MCNIYSAKKKHCDENSSQCFLGAEKRITSPILAPILIQTKSAARAVASNGVNLRSFCNLFGTK
ncbi:MAG: hypothetical protein ACI4MN_03980 [Candidatus Coproplasma sp.]